MKKKMNYLDKIPLCSSQISYKTDENGAVTLNIENKGFINRIAQKLFKKPSKSYIHLDETGSFVWNQIDGSKTVYDIAVSLEKQFGQNSHPLYERLACFFSLLDKNKFIIWVK